MSKNIVIMINGKSNFGKGVVADLIIENTSKEYHKIKSSLSTYIRQIMYDDFFYNGEDNKEAREFMAETYRLGSKLYKHHMARRVWERDNRPYLSDTQDNLIIVESLREKHNYDYYNDLLSNVEIDELITLRIERPDFDSLKDDKLRNHISETDMDNFIIYNDGDESNYVERLREQVVSFIDRMNLKPFTMDVIIDFDNVLVDTDITIADYYNNFYYDEEGFVEADRDNIYYYDAHDQCPLLTKDAMYDLFSSNFFWDNIDFKEDALSVTRELCSDYRFNVSICSMGNNNNKSKKAKFIEKHLDFVEEVVLTDGKFFSKNDISSDKIILDDHQNNLMNKNAFNVLMYDNGERDYNKNATCLSVTSWSDFYELCNDIYWNYEHKYIDTTFKKEKQ